MLSILTCSCSLCSSLARSQYSTVHYSTVQYSTVQYSTVQYSTVQYSTVQLSGQRQGVAVDAVNLDVLLQPELQLGQVLVVVQQPGARQHDRGSSCTQDLSFPNFMGARMHI